MLASTRQLRDENGYLCDKDSNHSKKKKKLNPNKTTNHLMFYSA